MEKALLMAYLMRTFGQCTTFSYRKHCWIEQEKKTKNENTVSYIIRISKSSVPGEFSK